MKRCAVRFIIAITVGFCARTEAVAPDGGEEFVGPFMSWANVKTDYGAVGDGVADDTEAIQRGLDDLRPPTRAHSVLYFPTGTYRITSRLNLVRTDQNLDFNSIGIIGEDPATTRIVWDGEVGGTTTMVYNTFYYSRMMRLTFDGAGKAYQAIWHGGGFATSNAYMDLIIQDVARGLVLGGEGHGVAETTILRCKFFRCSDRGILVTDWNSLDEFVRYCLFEDCGVAVANDPGCGNFHVYESVFRRSRGADIQIANLGYFSVRNNTSIDSHVFLWAACMGAGGLMTIQGNTVIDPEYIGWAVFGGNLGPWLFLDNVIKSREQQTTEPVVINCNWGQSDFFFLGNTYSVQNHVAVEGARLVELDESVVPRESLNLVVPELPPTPPNLGRRIFDIPPEAGAAEIQAAINAAAALSGQGPVVHIPSGIYTINQTLVVPANCDVQIIGDGMASIGKATQLVAGNLDNAPILTLQGPTRATVSELSIIGGDTASHCLLVQNCDQVGGRVFMQGTTVGGNADIGLLVTGLEHTDISLHDFYHGGNSATTTGVRIVGGPFLATGKPVDGRAVLFSGASGENMLSYDLASGARLIARDIWYEGDPRRFVRLTGSGEFTLHGASVCVGSYGGETDTSPAIDIDGFQGKVTFIGTAITSRNSTRAAIRIQGEGAGTKVLFLGNQFEIDHLFENDSPEAQVAVLANQEVFDTEGQTRNSPNIGDASPEFVKSMLEQTRTTRPRPLNRIPDGLTDLRLYRVMLGSPSNNSRIGIELRSGDSGCYQQKLFEQEWGALSAALGWGPEPLDADQDGLPDLWAAALVAHVLCRDNLEIYQSTWDAYMQNLRALDQEGQSFNGYRECLAALLLTSGQIRDLLVTQLALSQEYATVAESLKTTAEPFSGAGDLDNDATTNLDEYNGVLSWGGDMNDFLSAATNPVTDGHAPMPAASAISLLLMIAIIATTIVWTCRRNQRDLN